MIHSYFSFFFICSDETADDLNARGGGGGPASKWGLSQPSFDEFFHENCSHYFGAKFIPLHL